MIPLTSKRYFMNNLGLNDKSASTALMDGEASSSQNVQHDVRGAIVKRKGYAKRMTAVIASAPAINGGIEFREKGGTTQVFIMTSNQKLYSDTETPGSSWTDETNSMTLTAGNTNYPCFTHTGDNDALVMTNQSDPPITIANNLDASTLTVPTNLTDAKYCIWWNNHLVLLNVIVNSTAYPLRFYIYEPGVINSVVDTHYLTLPSKDEAITGVAELFGNLYIFTNNEIHQFSGTSYDDFSRITTSSNVGTVSYWSIQNIENNLVFLSPKGVAVFDGIKSIHISDKIQATLDGLSETRKKYAQSAHYRKRSQYLLSVSSSGSGTHNRVLLYDYRNKAWSVFVGINANCFINTRRSDNTERLYHGDYAGFAYLNDSTDNDSGTAIDGFWKSKAIDLDSDLTKSFRHIIVNTVQKGSFNLNVEYEVDFGGGGSSTTMTQSLVGGLNLWGAVTGMVWGTNTWGGGVVLTDRLNFVPSVGRYIRIRFRTTSTDTPFTINGFTIFAQPMGIR